jgi:REP element-mobilizing transposase RayT
MPRQQRVKGEFSTYHVIQRGNERKHIFLNDYDKTRFLQTLAKTRDKYNFLIYAYCLMDNHVHMLMYDNGNDVSKIVKSLNISYANYFNRVYLRTGHLFQDRFKSEIVENDNYLLEASKYIHNNPVKAGMVETPDQFIWSSYNIYIGKTKDTLNIINTDKVLGCISSDRKKAISEYARYVTRYEEDEIEFLDIGDERQADKKNQNYITGLPMARERIAQMLSSDNKSMEELKTNKTYRNEMICKLRKNSSLSLKELGALFGGISESRVSRIIKRERE